MHLQPFGSGENIIKYLGRYVCRTAIGDSRIVSITDTHVSFRYKDRANGERVAFHTGRPLLVGTVPAATEKPPHVVSCPCCGEPMKKLLRLLPAWSRGRAPPPLKQRSRA